MELIGWIIDSVGGWRYIVSSSYRTRTHARWLVEGKMKALFDIFFGVSAVVFTILVIGFLIDLLRG